MDQLINKYYIGNTVNNDISFHSLNKQKSNCLLVN